MGIARRSGKHAGWIFNEDRGLVFFNLEKALKLYNALIDRITSNSR
jgi:hypothetical protein